MKKVRLREVMPHSGERQNWDSNPRGVKVQTWCYFQSAAPSPHMVGAQKMSEWQRKDNIFTGNRALSFRIKHDGCLAVLANDYCSWSPLQQYRMYD